jgi:hypothetical protein
MGIASPSGPGLLPGLAPQPVAPMQSVFLVREVGEIADPAERRRRKLSDLAGNLHCSIIGSCLSPAELRRILGRLGLAQPGATDHDLHGRAVSLAGQQEGAAKLLTKALDTRHKLAISRYARVTSEAAVRTLWKEDLGCGEIPGPYWAVLSHPATTQTLLSEVFGEVHMLSHMVGAANRAHIQTLRALESRSATLEASLQEARDQYIASLAERDATIAELRHSLSVQTLAATAQLARAEAGCDLGTRVADLERRFDLERNRRTAAERRAETAEAETAALRAAAEAVQEREAGLLRELAAIEATFGDDSNGPSKHLHDPPAAGLAVLYVGGRPNQIAHIAAAAARAASPFEHHDGGVEEAGGRLPALVGRADIVMFPVDCVSHDAVAALKRACRQAGKPFIPLRTASVTAFLAGLHEAAA